MAELTLISNRPVNEYEAFLLDLMNEMDKHRIRSMTVVVTLEEKTSDGGDAIVGYHNASLRDRQLAASLIQADITYKIAQDAVRDYMEED